MSQPPVATVLSITATKLSYRPGTDQVIVRFSFDQPVTEWAVRINSTSHLDGNEAVPLSGLTGLGFGQMAFGSAPFGGIAAGTTIEGSVRIDSDMLLHGANQVTIYGKGLDGRWSVAPVGAVPAAP
jgi:hypothetical protein